MSQKKCTIPDCLNNGENKFLCYFIMGSTEDCDICIDNYQQVHVDNTLCDYHRLSAQITCNYHGQSAQITCICPHTFEPFLNSPDNVKKIVPSEIRHSAIKEFKYFSNDPLDVFFHMDGGMYINVRSDYPWWISVYNYIGVYHLYHCKGLYKEYFLQIYEQYTYKPILDSLYQNHIMYIHSLPKDITGIIRTYL